MAVEIRVPQMGESVVEATILRWLKKEGESFQAGEPLVELETDKVNVEVPADAAGVLERITRKEGEAVTVNDVLGLIGEPGTVSAPAPSGSTAATPATAPPAEPSPQENGRQKVPASPVAVALANAKGVDLEQVVGSGPGGKRLKEDVEAHLSRAALSSATTAVAPPPVEPAPPKAAPPVVEAVPVRPAATGAESVLKALLSTAPDSREERVPMSRRRQTIAANLIKAQQTAAMLTTFNEVDMSAIMEVRKRRRDSFKERHGVGLGFMSFFTKATIGALKAFPYLNAEIQGTDIILKKHYDIGIAVGASEGLVVPVVRDADTKTFAQIEKEIGDLAGRARENKLTLNELIGGTFTLTNGGVFGSLLSTPILNYPQVGILGMHKIQERPIALDGQVVIRPMMYLALSYDHRIVDGSEAVRFLVRIKELIEDPETLLLEG